MEHKKIFKLLEEGSDCRFVTKNLNIGNDHQMQIMMQ